MSEKIQKVLAREGLGSRREIERWIEAGRISVNGKPATLGDRVEADACISVDGKPVQLSSVAEIKRRVLIYNKPEGEICSRNDPEGRTTVFEKLPAIETGRWISVGRLDINSSGLLLFTNDGELANKLTHPSSEIEREYSVRVLGEVDGAILEKLLHGVKLEDGMARFTSIEEGGGQGINRWYHVVIKEGRKREVRRLWESQGLKVSRLIRVRFGLVHLPRELRAGEYSDLDKKMVRQLESVAGIKPRAHTSGATKTLPPGRSKTLRKKRKRSH